MRGGGSYYELLKVRHEASPEELRRAYELALSRASRDGATRHMVDIVAAYEVLSDPNRRQRYDETGVALHRERVPNIHGRAVPWRGGASAPLRRGGVPGRSITPYTPRRRMSPVAVAVLCLAVGGVGGAFAVQAWPSAASDTRTIPAGVAPEADGFVPVICRTEGGSGYALRARPGQEVTCANGATPSWGSPTAP